MRVHAAGDLQQREPVQAGVHGDRQAAGRQSRELYIPASRSRSRCNECSPNPEYAIDVQDLNKHFGDKHVVNNVSMRVRKGEIFGFLGPQWQRQDHHDSHDVRPAEA